MDAVSTHEEHQEIPAVSAEPLRRRVIFELRLEELPLLQAAERRHGTKRAALVHALEAEGQCETMTAELDEARARIAELEETLTKERANTDRELAKREQETKENASALARAQAALKKKAAGSKALSRDTAAERGERLRLEAELEELEQLAVDELYCARCNNWVEPSAWAWKKGREGTYAYHRTCGDHRPGLVGASSWLAWRAP